MKTTKAKNNTRISSVQTTWCLATILLLLLSVLPAAAQDQIEFFGEQGGMGPDKVLTKYLSNEVQDLNIEYQASSYEHVIDKLVGIGDFPFLARTTPYVFVVAEMLGAKMEVLGVYKSKATGTTTYNTYFVVNRDDFRHLKHSPTLKDLTDFLKEMGRRNNPANFIFHNKFSTSSYFLPSLFFKNHGIYSMKPSGESVLIPIESRLIKEKELRKKDKRSSTDLVLTVGDNQGVFAAVWDGTKTKFEQGGEYQDYSSKVHFIKIETPLPNDLLVNASSLDGELKNRISAAIARMTHKNLSESLLEKDLEDVLFWIGKNAIKEDGIEARKAHRALTHLRSLAQTQIKPAIIDVQVKKKTGLSDDHREAARHAVRLSGTELRLVKEPQKADIIWTLEAIHDEAILLTSVIKGHKEATQIFRMSYKKGNMKDLTKRFGDIIQTRMHRIRYIWPYKSIPTVIRDISFPIDPQVSVEKLTWVDPEKNVFLDSSSFPTKVTKDTVNDLYKFQLDPLGEGHNDYDDPISNVSYRVVLRRLTEENTILTVLTGVYVALMVFSAVGAVYGCKQKT